MKSAISVTAVKKRRLVSDKTVAQKLLIKQNNRILLIGALDNYQELLVNLPPGVTISTKPEGLFDIILLFAKSKVELESRLSEIKGILNSKLILWLTYTNCTSNLKTT